MGSNPKSDMSAPPTRRSIQQGRPSRRAEALNRVKSATSLGLPRPAEPLSPAKKSLLPMPRELLTGEDVAIADARAERSMAALVGRIVGAKPFPESARRLAQLTRADVVRIEPVVQVLERDPGLSARLLRLVNSAGYALRQRCTSVRHAATLVGTDRLHQIATTAAVLDLFRAEGSMAVQIVEHSTYVGAFCRYFGAYLGQPVDDLFTAGFLHDLGKLMLLETESGAYVRMLEEVGLEADRVHILERERFGFDHAMLAGHVLSAWSIPDPIPKIVALHHAPLRAERSAKEIAPLVHTLRLADAAVAVVSTGGDRDALARLAELDSAASLGLGQAQLASMWDELHQLIEESREQVREKNAPALDPRSLRPRQPLSIAVPGGTPSLGALLEQPCVVCGRTAFGHNCPGCGGVVCADHRQGKEGFCALCVQEYKRASMAPVKSSLPQMVALSAAAVVMSGVIGMWTAGGAAAVRAALGTFLLIVLIAVSFLVGRSAVLRLRFRRQRGGSSRKAAVAGPSGRPLEPPLTPPSRSEAALLEDLDDGTPSVFFRRPTEHPVTPPSSSEPLPSPPRTVEQVTTSLDTPPVPEGDLVPGPMKSPAPFESRPAMSVTRIELQGQSLVTLPPEQDDAEVEARVEAPRPISQSPSSSSQELSHAPASTPALGSGAPGTTSVIVPPCSEKEPSRGSANAPAPSTQAPPATLGSAAAPVTTSPVARDSHPDTLSIAGAQQVELPTPVEAVAPSDVAEQPAPPLPEQAKKESDASHPLAALGLAPSGHHPAAQADASAPASEPPQPATPELISTPKPAIHDAELAALIADQVARQLEPELREKVAAMVAERVAELVAVRVAEGLLARSELAALHTEAEKPRRSRRPR